MQAASDWLRRRGAAGLWRGGGEPANRELAASCGPADAAAVAAALLAGRAAELPVREIRLMIV